MADSTVRFSDVAHFVGLSLQRAPKSLKVKPKPPVGSQSTVKRKKAHDTLSESCSSIQMELSGPQAQSEIARPPMQQARSLPSLPVSQKPQLPPLQSPQHRRPQVQAQFPA